MIDEASSVNFILYAVQIKKLSLFNVEMNDSIRSNTNLEYRKSR